MDWVALITAVLEAFKNCPEKNDSKIVRLVRESDEGTSRFFERQVRKALGIGPFEWVAKGPAIMADLRAEADDMSDAELLAFVKKAKAA